MTAEEMIAAVGTESLSDWITVSQTMIDAFADATGDRQFIHVDPERAKATPFGGTIAHGFLTLSLLPQLAERTSDAPRLDGAVMGVNYGGDRVRFLSPVPAGSRIRARSTLRSFERRRPGVFQYMTETVIEIEGQEKPAMIADWITQVFA